VNVMFIYIYFILTCPFSKLILFNSIFFSKARNSAIFELTLVRWSRDREPLAAKASCLSLPPIAIFQHSHFNMVKISELQKKYAIGIFELTDGKDEFLEGYEGEKPRVEDSRIWRSQARFLVLFHHFLLTTLQYKVKNAKARLSRYAKDENFPVFLEPADDSLEELNSRPLIPNAVLGPIVDFKINAFDLLAMRSIFAFFNLSDEYGIPEPVPAFVPRDFSAEKIFKNVYNFAENAGALLAKQSVISAQEPAPPQVFVDSGSLSTPASPKVTAPVMSTSSETVNGPLPSSCSNVPGAVQFPIEADIAENQLKRRKAGSIEREESQQTKRIRTTNKSKAAVASCRVTSSIGSESSQTESEETIVTKTANASSEWRSVKVLGRQPCEACESAGFPCLVKFTVENGQEIYKPGGVCQACKIKRTKCTDSWGRGNAPRTGTNIGEGMQFYSSCSLHL
jgi:hypothetical protein